MFRFAKYGTKEVNVSVANWNLEGSWQRNNVLVNIAQSLQIKSIGQQAKEVV